MTSGLAITARQREIADLVQSNGFASVESLAERFDVTTQTIRRDLTRLCEHGILRRTHGGVEPPAPAGNLHYARRQILNLPQKRAIAETVAREVPDGASLAFSIGTTPEIVMQALAHHQGLRVFTNNLHVAFSASQNPDFEVTIAGGRLRHGDRDILGADTERFFSAYKVDIGVFGVAGVDADGTLLDFHEDEVAARQAILANCRRAFLVLDASKFGRPAHVRGGHITDVATVFCDDALPASVEALLAAAGRESVVCTNNNEER
ncbi:DeoR/GlpR family DNA-binding transcription regulator [Stappia indica]|uniref:DeoR/GlpR family DNA-binding transcription regulator n=1 Tax=Stappia indica TaxID=538381 RepID=UPI00082A1ACE|nr:DeoR/GlpR family DNA-binding transcription regulator [Stappia indica]MCC4242795.1 DeoR/GlpR family DNA-binding transcription regulator [Stappia indica]